LTSHNIQWCLVTSTSFHFVLLYVITFLVPCCDFRMKRCLYPQMLHASNTCVTRLTRRVPLVEQELLTLPEHPSSPPVFSEVRVTRSLVLCVCLFSRSLFDFLYIFFWPLCFSSIYGLGLLLWYLQTLLLTYMYISFFLLICEVWFDI